MFYKNTSIVTKKFHNVEFKPGEVKEVSDFINHPAMVLVDKPTQPKKVAEEGYEKKQDKVDNSKNSDKGKKAQEEDK